MLMNMYKNYKFEKNDVLTFFLMLTAFSVPFGKYGVNIKKVVVYLFIVWVLSFGFKHVVSAIKSNSFLKVYTLLIIFYFISLLWSSHPYEGWRYIRNILMFTYIPLLMYVTSVSKRNIDWIVSAFIASMFVNEIISYMIYFDVYQTAYSKIHHYPVGFINHIPYSVLVAFTAILILYQAKYLKNKYLKVIYIIFFITMTTNLVISGGRTGYVVYFVTLFIMLFSYYKVNWKNFLQVLIFPVIIFLIAYTLNGDVRKRVESSVAETNKVTGSQNYNTSFGARLASYPLAYQILKDNSFIVGVGVGDLVYEKDNAIKKHHLEKSMHIVLHHKHLHNFYADTIVTLGVIGLFILLLAIYKLWNMNIVNRESRFMQQLIVLVLITSNIADRMLHTRETMLFFAVFIGVVIARSKLEESKV